MRKNILIKVTLSIGLSLLLIGNAVPQIFGEFEITNIAYAKEERDQITVTININPDSIVYEGDIVNCTITGDPTVQYWQINDRSEHYTFYGDNPVIFDPEPTPLDDKYVNLTVYAENTESDDSDTIRVLIKRIFFGDIQFHSSISDGYHKPDTLYQNAIEDNYLDFVCLTDHAEIINQIDLTPPQPIWMRLQGLYQFIMYKFFGVDEWKILKEKVEDYYDPGRFTTILGFEYSPGPWFPGGFLFSPNGHEDVGHLCFYYKEVYDDAPEYSAWDKYTFEDIFEVMAQERDKGHLNVGFPHHPLMKINFYGAYTVNWTFLANNIQNTDAREKVLRGVETYSKWGTAIGKYSNLPVNWPYDEKYCVDEPDYWVENGLWEWSEVKETNQLFALMASSDTHGVDRPGSASMQSNRISKNHPNPAGIVAAYSSHNTRGEIWDALNNCTIYGSQILKIRSNVRFDGKMAIGRWINCTSPLTIRITAQSTFPGVDSSGRNMWPHSYSPDELDYPIQDIWIIKKDTEKGQPWCKIIKHVEPDSDLAIVEFEDSDVQPNDFYYIAIRQKGQLLEENQKNTITGERDEYMAFLGPVFIDNVE